MTRIWFTRSLFRGGEAVGAKANGLIVGRSLYRLKLAGPGALLETLAGYRRRPPNPGVKKGRFLRPQIFATPIVQCIWPLLSSPA